MKYPCGKCSKTVTARQRGIKCSGCEIWHHAAYVSLSVAEYDALSDDVGCLWYCPSCVVAINNSQLTDTSLTSVKYENNSLTSITSADSTMCFLCCSKGFCSSGSLSPKDWLSEATLQLIDYATES